jgi:hypothetical protein
MLVTAVRPDGAAVQRHLTRLNKAYPAFRFYRELFGSKGARWVAERRDPAERGLYVMITNDLMELHAAVLRDKERHALGR